MAKNIEYEFLENTHNKSQPQAIKQTQEKKL